jgi:hypothetical protein
MSDERRRVEAVIIPLAEESASVSKRAVETGQVRVALSTDIGVVQNGQFMGYTESGQSHANQGIPRFACNPDLSHALVSM